MDRSANPKKIMKIFLCFSIVFLAACAAPTIPNKYHDPEMDFASVQTLAVMPFQNLTSDKLASGRVRDVFSNKLLSMGSIYVIPAGETARGISRAGITDPTAPSAAEIVKMAAIVKVDAVITGVVREYGIVKSGAASANVISFSLQLFDVQSQKVVWTASSTKGGISTWDRLLGSGGQPMNDITEAAIDDIIDKLFIN